MTSTDRVDPPLAADEATMLRAFLDYHRDTFRQKTAELDAAQLARTLAPSTMTLGGMTKHLALVEDNWLSIVLLGHEDAEPWRGVDWTADPDWEWHTAAQDSPAELRRLLDAAVAASDRILDEVLADPSTGGLDRLSARERRRSGERFSLRWILLHLIEEYARHNGHADLIRESIDVEHRRVSDRTIRAATEADWPAIWPFFEATVRAGETYTYPQDTTYEAGRELWLEPLPVETVVLEEDGEVLGTARMGPNRTGHGDHIGTASFMVAPAARGRGVGRALGEHVIAWHRERGYRGIQFNAVVEKNTAAVRLWESLGFEVVGTVPGAFRSPTHGYAGLHVMFLPLT